MKTAFWVAALSSIVLNLAAQTSSSPGQTSGSTVPQDTPYAIVHNEANSRTWERTTYEQLPSGQIIPHIHRYIETATGLNYKDPNTGQWTESSDLIEQVPGGAVAQHGQHTVIFAADLATFGAIDMETPDGQRLQSHLLGLSYYDTASGQSVMIAEVTNCIGQLVGTNQVWYQNAFSGLNAGVHYTYTRAGFEQDIILEERPQPPEAYGLNSSSTVLQALTEFVSYPNPTLSIAYSAMPSGQEMPDQTLNFGTMRIGRGRAFLMGNDSDGVSVSKEWLTLNGRQFLVEEIPVSEISSQLQALPLTQSASVRTTPNSILNVASSKRLLPPQPIARIGTNQMMIARLSVPKSGFVLDYNTVNTSQTNYTFRGDTTYYISGNVDLYGTNTVFEGGTIIKYTNGVSLGVHTPVDFRGSPYRPVVMLSKDDNTIAEPITGSTGNPGSSYYATKALYFDGVSAGTNLNIRNLRVLNANAAVVINGQTNNVLSDLQFVDCADGVAATNADFCVRNGLFALVQTNFTGSASTGHVEHLTSDGAIWLNKDIGSNLFLTNCLLSAVTNLGSCTTQSVAVVSSGSGVFQTVGAGYYLAANSPYRDAGTLNINPDLLAQLALKTTYPPVLCQNSNFNVLVTLEPTAQRDTNAPDLGFHYDPMDYVFSGVNVNTNLTIAAGTAVGWFKPASSQYAVHLADKVKMIFNGQFAEPDYFVQANTVQETNGAWAVNSGFGIVGSQNQGTEDISYSSEIDMNFTLMSVLIYGQQFRDYSGYLIARANNSILAGGNVGGYLISHYFTNCLMDNQQVGTVYGFPGNEICLRNCTLHNGVFYGQRVEDIPISVRDCSFDGVSLSGVVDGFANDSTNTDYNYNAYTNAVDPFPNPTGITNDQRSVSFNWQTGPLGRFYLPTNSVLIDAGDVTADTVGLYHFTTQTNQVKEGDSKVDIGYHYLTTGCNQFDVVWVEDAVPAGASTSGDYESWTWVSSAPPPYSGSLASQSAIVSGEHQHFFVNATATLSVNTGDTLIAYVYLDPANPPTEVMLQWNDGSWAHRAYWGASNYLWGPAYHAGALPPVGQWVRLEVPANLVGLEGRTVSGMAFSLYDGRATWDHAGKSTAPCYDTDGDGIPDYLEDANGNGLVDPGESSWLLGIDSQPQSQNVVQGQNVTFSVVAGGATPLSYQWMSNGVDIAGATSSTFTKLVVTTNDEADYSVVVTNYTGSVTSTIAALTVNTPLSITGQPAPETVVEGSNAIFSVTVSGNYPVYQWFTNGVALNNSTHLSGATSSTLTISNVSVSDAVDYSVVVTNLFNSVTSSSALLTVLTKPGVSSAPTNTTAIQSDDVTLSAVATGGDLIYQWWLTNSLGTNSILNATNTSYTKLVVLTNDAGHYSLVITNLAGSTNLNADLTVLVPPWINQQPTTRVLTNQGSNVTFSISAFGTTNLYYQWYKNGSNAIANATNSSLTLNNIQPADAAGYSAVVTNIAGTNVSAWAWLSILLTGGGTNNGWGGGSSPPNGITNYMISPTNSSPTNPAIYLYGPAISIRASTSSQYSYITNVAFYFTGTNYTTNFMLAGTATPGANTKFALAWTNALPGTNILKARAWDYNGNTNDSGLVYVIMDQAPNITTTPSTKTLVWESFNTNVWFTNVVSDDGLPYGITNISWSIPAGVTTSNITTYTPSNIIISTDATFTNSGYYPLQINVSDGFTNTSSSCNVKIQHRPIISFNSPTNDEPFLTNTPIVLNAMASDPDGTVANVTFYNGGSSLGQGIPSAGSTYVYAWYSAPLGTNLVSAVATDNDGLSSTSSVAVIVVPPLTVQFVSPTNDQFFIFSPTNIYLTALPISYVGSTITSLLFTNVTQSRYLGAGSLTNSEYQMLWTDVTNGTYTISVTARDNVGNVASNDVTVTINAMPVVHITSPTSLQSFLELTNVTLNASAFDSDGSVAGVGLYATNLVAGNRIGLATNAPGSTNYSLIWSNLSAGTYPIMAVATDNWGAISVSELGVFRVAPTNPPPWVAIVDPTNTSVFSPGSDLTITALATNRSGSVTNVDFYANGVLLGSATDGSQGYYRLTECCWKPGVYVLVAVSTDNLGNVGRSAPVTNTIAQPAPSGAGFWDAQFGGFSSVVGDGELAHSVAVGNDGSLFASQDNPDSHPYVISYQEDGTNWSAFVLGSTNTGDEYISSIKVIGTNVYGASDFDNLSVYKWVDDGSRSVASWYGNLTAEGIWTPLGTNFDNPVLAIESVGNDFYVAGAFTSSGGNTNVQYVARYDAVSNIWDSVSAVPLNGPVYALASMGGKLYAGGVFTSSGSVTNLNGIARLDGNQWVALDGGLLGDTNWVLHPLYYPAFTNGAVVRSLSACGDNLFVGGQFLQAGPVTNANGIAIWNEQEGWSSPGGVNFGTWDNTQNSWVDGNAPCVYTVKAHGNDLFIGGDFTNIVQDGVSVTEAYKVAQASWSEAMHKWAWTALDDGLFYSTDPSQDQYDECFISGVDVRNGTTPGSYDLFAGGSYNTYAGGSERTISPSLALWRSGQGVPSSPLAVTITNPPNFTIYSNLPVSSIGLTAVVSGADTNPISVTFFYDGVSLGNGTDNGNGTFGITWSSPPSGVHLLTAVVADDIDPFGGYGQKTAESKPVLIQIENPSNTVTANNDSFTVIANDPPALLNVLANDSSTNHPLQIVSAFHAFWGATLGTIEVSYDRSNIIYRPFPNTYGSETIAYSVTDGISTNSAYATVNVLARPQVTFSNPSDGQRISVTNGPVTVSGSALAYGTVITNLGLCVNGVPWGQTNNANFSFAWSTNVTGFYTFTAIATDGNGITNVSAPVTIAIYNPSAPAHTISAVISNLTPTLNAFGDQIDPVITTGIFDLQGRAADSISTNPVSYKVMLYQPNNGVATQTSDPNEQAAFYASSPPFADVTPGPLNAVGFHVGGDTNGDLRSLNLAGVANGVYELVLEVRGGADVTNTLVEVQLNSQLKIGQFSFSEQDLVLPVSGIPVTVTRTYNSMNPNSGEFGYSWTYALNAMDVRLDEQRQDVSAGSDGLPWAESSGTGPQNTINIRSGGNRDVTLTLPEGQTATFQFYYDGPYGTDGKYYAAWHSPAGVNYTLTESDPITGGPSYYDSLTTCWDNEANFAFDNFDFPGFILSNNVSGVTYQITRGAGKTVSYDPTETGNFVYAQAYGAPKLTEIDERSGDKIIIGDNSIYHQAPDGTTNLPVTFDRDPQGRITALHDPNGGSNGLPVAKYIYNDDTGNLIQVLKLEDRNTGTYTTNKYSYDDLNFPHYITSIENGLGIPVARNYYDDSGRLTEVDDANGTKTKFNHSLTNNSEVVIDRLNNTNTYVYDLQGNVILVTNALGQVTATAYTNPNFPALKTAETNAYGTAQATWTLYSYDQSGNQTNVISMGHTNSFAYDNNQNLITQVDPLGNVTQNNYDTAGNLTSTAQYDAGGHLITQSSSIYIDGKLTETLNANSQPTATFGYDEFGNLTNTTDANGFTRSFAYDANGNQTNSTYQWTPPGGGSSKTVTNSTEYDASGRVVQTIDGLGNTNQTFYNALGKVDYTIDKFGSTNSFVYDALGNLIQTTYPNGTSTQTAYDAAGRAYLTEDRNGITGTRTDYDAEGRATNTVRLTNVVINIVYNGSVAASEVDSAGVPISTNSTVYDAAGRVTSRTSPDGVTSYAYYPDGQLMQVVDALNETNSYAYDAAGRQTNVVDALNHSTSFQYDAVGRMIATIYNDNTATTNVFDNLGQRTQIVDQAKLVTQFGYSLSGQLTNVIKPSVPDPETGISSTNAAWSYLYDSYGHPTVTIDPKGRGTTNFFDAYSRQFSQRLAMNQTNLVEYNSLGQVVTNFDFKGQYTLFGYDQFGRLKTKCFFTSTGYLSNSVCYVYDNLDRITNITECYGADATTNCLAFLDPLWRHPSGPESRAAKAWAVVKATGPKWSAPLVALAILYWLLSLPVGCKLREMLAWYYLRGGWRQNFHRRGAEKRRLRLPSLFWRVVTVVIVGVFIADDPSWDNLFTARADCSIPSNASTLTTRVTNLVYNPEGNLTQVNSPEGVINYDYDLATGRLTSTCTTNSYLAYTYDALGRLKTVTISKRNGSGITPETTTYGYDAVGNRSSMVLPNGITDAYHYDSLNRLTNLTHQAGGTNLASYSYVLDATGRRTNATEVLWQDTGGYLTNKMTWQYDGMYRLTNEVNACSASGASYTDTYAYDLVGNRLMLIQNAGSAVTTTNVYDANDELVKEVTVSGGTATGRNNYAYDANGSMIGKTNTTTTGTSTNVYTYDLMNKLSSVTTASGTTGFQYNDQGIRVRTTGASTRYYLIDANNHTGYQQVLEEFTTLGSAPSRSYVIGDDVLAQADSGSASYLLYDGHGSTRQMASNTGAVTSRYNYDAYGITQAVTSTTTPETSMLYCGEQYESALQMYNLRARYYNPSNGRFNQRDTFQGYNDDPQSLHKYLYVNSDPINRLDPSGHDSLAEQLMVLTIAFIGLTMNTISLVNHLQSGNYKAVPWDVLGILLALAGAKGGGNGLTYAPASGSTLIPFASNFSAGARLTLASGSSIIGGVDLMMQSGNVDHPQFSSPPPSQGPFPNQMPSQLNDELAWVDRAGIVPAEPGTAKFWEVLQENPVVKWAVTKDGKFGIVPYKVKIGGIFRQVPHTAITRGADAWAGEASLRGDTLYLNKLSGHYTPETYSPGEVAFGNTGLKVKYVSGSLVP